VAVLERTSGVGGVCVRTGTIPSKTLREAAMALYPIGRTGATESLNLEAAGLAADDRGRLEVNDRYQTAVPHIFAVGDVIGLPSLASTSHEQGRLAACHPFGISARSVPSLVPYAIYTIPRDLDRRAHRGGPHPRGRAS
jgi:pyruvate/2-oxoglutarate dehydrogenase complex dihydrolipoamide dehydrogenase (E3) component